MRILARRDARRSKLAMADSSKRAAMLNRWTQYYKWPRPHHGIGGVAPIRRLKRSRNNLLTLHT